MIDPENSAIPLEETCLPLFRVINAAKRYCPLADLEAEKKAKEEKLKIELVNKQIKEIVPVSFGSVYADVSKRDGNYQQVFFSLKSLGHPLQHKTPLK